MDPNQQLPVQPTQPTPPQAGQPAAPPLQPQANPDYQPAQPAGQYYPGQPASTPPPAGYAPQTQPTPNPYQPAPQTVVNDNGQDYSIEYLDKIAPETKTTTIPTKLIAIVVGLIVAVIVAVALMALSSDKPTTLDYATELNARLASLAEVSKKQHKYLSDNPLRASNTAYQLFLNNALADLKEPLAAAGLEKEAKKALTAKEETFMSELTTKFDDARLNAILDRTYALEMSYQISVIENMMHRIYKGTNHKQLREYLDSAKENLTPIAKDFREFSDTTSSPKQPLAN